MRGHHTYGGGIDQTAIIGHPPEDREWTPDTPTYPVKVGFGVRIEAFATIDAGMTLQSTVLQDQAWLFKHAHVGHDAYIGRRAEVGTGSIVGGHVTVEDDVRIGIGVVILPYRWIGEGAVIGAGSVVTKDVPAGATVAGNPARLLSGPVMLVPHTQRQGEKRWVT